MSKTPIGNIKGFSIELLRNIVFVVGVGYMGGSVSALCSEEFETIFSEKDRPMNCSVRNFIKHPLPCISYLTYPLQYIKTDESWLWNRYVNWLIQTYANTFGKIYDMYIAIMTVGNEHVNGFIGSLFVFYLMPIFLIHFTPWIPFIGAILAAILSTYLKDGIFYLLSPLVGWMFGVKACKEKISIGSIFIILGYWIVTSFFPFVNILWLLFIYYALWIYARFILALSPLLYKDGFYKVCAQISRHKIGLTSLFMLLTLRSSVQFLIKPVTTGFTVCMLYVLYKLSNQKKSV